ncbi:MAG: ABC transporter substrate-binding protein [Candidatus Methylomirabilales bacterium]
MRSLRGLVLAGGLILPAVLGCGPRAGLEHPGLVIGIATDPTTLDPRVATDAVSLHLTELIFSSLVRTDAGLRVIPDLAERWEQPDPRTYIFALRSNVRFHHGPEVTADDVRYTYESLRDPRLGSAYAGVLKEVEEIEVLDRYRIAFRLRRPFSPFLYHLTLGIVPADRGAAKDFGQRPVGSGPFRFAGWAPNERVELTAFAGHFRGGPRVNRIRFRVIPDATIRYLELRKGSLDLLPGELPPELLPVAQALPGYRLLQGPSSNYTYLGFNLRDRILRDRRVREAIALAIDREGLVRHLLRGQAIPATGPLFPGHWAYQGKVGRLGLDRDRAERLLDAAGYRRRGGVRFELEFKATTDELNRAIAEAIQYQLGLVGITVRIRGYEWGTFYADIKSGNFQIYVLTWVGITDPDYLHYLFHSESIPPVGANRGFYMDPEVDRLLEAGRETTDWRKRRIIYGRVQQILAQDLPYVSLWHERRWALVKKRLRGFTLMPGGELTPLQDVWIDGSAGGRRAGGMRGR